MRRETARRMVLGGAGAGILVAGLAVHAVGVGPVAGFAGDALYAALIFVLVALVAPRLPSLGAASIALGFCALIELLQLTPVPAALSRSIPGASLVVGSTFQWSDLAAYTIGAALAGMIDTVVRRHARGIPASD
ncbi:DUF2809 domain-containing protein [Leifsonia sp. NPDC058292]|uniref:ribosomal maturation YjgA family protein n=1 Tax=Leifsonia sp. NPDC058292 TaxID=3346428 RepID=UPI0036DB7985